MPGPGGGYPDQRVSRVLDRLKLLGKLPEVLVGDNGTEFTSRAMLRWSKARDLKLHFMQPNKPTRNACIESFNGKFRHERLRRHLISSMA